jgi:hypothetical protein
MSRLLAGLLSIISFFFTVSAASAHEQEQIKSASIPKVSRPPKLEDFIEGNPREAELKITDFRQFDPGDGDPVSQPTTAYLSYDDNNLYVAFICKDDPAKIRAQMTRRDALLSDDRVDISIDTFHDHRRNYWFEVNPFGIQMDGTNRDGMDDLNFDTLWYSDGRITSDGYIVFMAIPFKSLRFPDNQTQTWGVMLGRSIQRNNEWSNWPYITRRLLPSWAGQFGHLEGLANISPGRNLQFIPYGLFSAVRYLDPYEPGTVYHTDNDPRAGLDAKMVLRDSLTLDMTLNPDFSQVESDSPQVTVNQRYEVYFPEKRPFFIENSDYFQTPENLFFSRRMVDPQVGMRLTGKMGRWGIGALAGDDRAAGDFLPDEDPRHDGRAAIGAFRLYRELGSESRAGALFTTRDFGPSSNRVFALDTRLNLKQNFTLTGQWVNSWTRDMAGHKRDGTAAYLRLSKSGRKFHMNAYYRDRSPGFEAQLGFIQRVDIRETGYDMGYLWRPERSSVISYGPHISGSVIWDSHGTLTDWYASPSFMLELTRVTNIYIAHTESFERFDGIDFRKSRNSVMVNSELLKWLYLSGDVSTGDAINYYPAPELDPFLGKSLASSFGVTLQPSSRLRLDETYLYTRFATEQKSGATVFNNHILRSKANYQFSRELSLRAIIDYNSILPNASYVLLENTKRLGFDLLLTYMLNPGTALHIGYTDNYENLRMDPGVSPYLQRSGFPDFSVGRQFFIKLSYLLRM